MAEVSVHILCPHWACSSLPLHGASFQAVCGHIFQALVPISLDNLNIFEDGIRNRVAGRRA